MIYMINRGIVLSLTLVFTFAAVALLFIPNRALAGSITTTKQIDENGDGIADRFATENEWQFSLNNGSPQPTDSNGQVVFADLATGEYMITEHSGPPEQAFYSGSGNNCVFNGASATANIGTGENDLDAQCNFVNSVAPAPDVQFNKTAPAAAHTGDTIQYGFEVTNSGNTTLQNIAITDTLIDIVSCPVQVLTAKQSMVCSAEYTIAQDYIGDILTNTATLSAQTTIDMQVQTLQIQSSAQTFIARPAITLQKSSDTLVPIENVAITYYLIVTNVGNVDLYNTNVYDPLANFINRTIEEGEDDILSVGETWTYYYYYVPLATQQIVNTAEVSFVDAFNRVTSATSVLCIYQCEQDMGGGDDDANVTTSMGGSNIKSNNNFITPANYLPQTGNTWYQKLLYALLATSLMVTLRMVVKKVRKKQA